MPPILKTASEQLLGVRGQCAKARTPSPDIHPNVSTRGPPTSSAVPANTIAFSVRTQSFARHRLAPTEARGKQVQKRDCIQLCGVKNFSDGVIWQVKIQSARRRPRCDADSAKWPADHVLFLFRLYRAGAMETGPGRHGHLDGAGSYHGCFLNEVHLRVKLASSPRLPSSFNYAKTRRRHRSARQA